MSSCELPQGWVRTSAQRARFFIDVLHRELPDDHVLQNVDLEAFADRDGASDDILFRRVAEPERFAIVHLTYTGRPERDARWPSVLVEGTFEQFLEYANEQRETERAPDSAIA